MIDSDLRAMAGRFDDRTIGRRVFVSERTPSTNDDARRYMDSVGVRAAHGAVFTTLEQTRGRGTRGRSWWAPPESALPISIVLSPERPLSFPSALTLTVSIAISDVVLALGGNVRIRWPNDLVDAQGGKLAGILAEAIAPTTPGGPHAFIVGIGVNVREPRSAPPADLLQPISSLERAGVRELARDTIAREIFRALERRLETLERGPFAELIECFNQRSWLNGKPVTVRRGGESISGTFVSMEPPLRVRIATADGIRDLAAEQVELLSHGDSPRTAH